MKRGVLLRHRGRQPEAAFALVELLTAAAIAAVALVAAYGWLWNVAALAERTDDQAQAATLAASAARALSADLGCCLGAAPPPAGRDPARSLSLIHRHVGLPVEEVLVAWDPGRSVVWRNAPGTYLADHVTHFAVSYMLADGAERDGADMTPSDWPRVRVVQVDLTAQVGSAAVPARTSVAVCSP